MLISLRGKTDKSMVLFLSRFVIPVGVAVTVTVTKQGSCDGKHRIRRGARPSTCKIIETGRRIGAL